MVGGDNTTGLRRKGWGGICSTQKIRMSGRKKRRLAPELSDQMGKEGGKKGGRLFIDTLGRLRGEGWFKGTSGWRALKKGSVAVRAL